MRASQKTLAAATAISRGSAVAGRYSARLGFVADKERWAKLGCAQTMR
jgi:hypothetical protein